VFPTAILKMKKTAWLLAIKQKLTSKKRISNSLVTLSSAAILAVYAAGYERTKPAADRFAAQTDQRRPAPIASIVGEPAPLSPLTEAVSPRVAAGASAPTIVSAPIVTTSAAVPGAPGPVAASEASDNLASSLSKPAELKPASEPVAVAIDARVVEPVAIPATPPPAAAAPAPAPVATPPAPPQSQYKDGSYFGWGTSRHGDIQANVVIQDGRIASAAISQCLTRYPCSWVAHLPGQVVSRQSPNVDYVSGATQSVNAYYYAVVEALSKAK
jgi:uncharacterized protein with FMN-binding domain